jgi:hypothetical protein
MYWTPKWSEKEESKLVFPILVKRTWNKDKELELRKKRTTGLLYFMMKALNMKTPGIITLIVTNFPLDLSTEKLVENSNH